MAQKVRAGAEASIAEIGAASAEIKRPLAVYDENSRLVEIIGRGHKGALVEIQRLPLQMAFQVITYPMVFQNIGYLMVPQPA